MMKDSNWKRINILRTTDRDYSGMHYSTSYAKKHKNRKDMYAQCGKSSVATEESVHIKKDTNGAIVYQVSGRDHSGEGNSDYNTQFGVFHSEDHGEFSGELTSPVGKNLKL